MKKILVVEDALDVARNIEYVLSKEGYAVVVAHDGASAIAMAREHLPDLILMDIMLPDIEGGEVVSIIKKNPACARIPVIFLTGLLSGAEGSQEGLVVNVNGKDYPALGKPFELLKLLVTIKKYLSP